MSSASQPAPARKRIFRFAVYELHAYAGELRKFGTRIPLQQQPMQVLLALVERPGEIVTREELRQRLWPADTFVDFEHSLNSAVKKLRRALNDDPAVPRFLETIPRQGYRFLAPVTSEAAEQAPVKPTSSSQDVAPSHHPWGALILGCASVLLLIALALLALRYSVWRRPGAERPRVEALAVLPLANLSSDPQQEFFVDGLTDALITSLGKQGGVRVISRTSVMRYKGTTKPLPVIARELNVDTVLEGTVLRSGNHVRITTQLVHAEPEEHLWAESYEGDLTDVLLLQDKLSRNIASQIQTKVTNKKNLGATGIRPIDAEAYDYYLRGRYFFDKRDESDTRKAISYFEQAVRKDPNYAPAYSGLADCYVVSWAGTSLNFAKGESYARQALMLQDDLAEAHASLGVARLYQYDLRTAERELKRATELDPNYSMAHHWYALYLLASGRTADALEENDLALRINPFSLPVNNARGIILTNMRRYDEALTQAERLRELEYNYAAYLLAARVHRLQREHGQAVAEQEKSDVTAGDKQRIIDQKQLTRVYAKAGYTAYLRKSVELKQKHYRRPYSATDLIFDYIELGRSDQALKWLERAYQEKEFFILMLKTAPELDSLRSDLRFQHLVQQIEISQPTAQQ